MPPHPGDDAPTSSSATFRLQERHGSQHDDIEIVDLDPAFTLDSFAPGHEERLSPSPSPTAPTRPPPELADLRSDPPTPELFGTIAREPRRRAIVAQDLRRHGASVTLVASRARPVVHRAKGSVQAFVRTWWLDVTIGVGALAFGALLATGVMAAIGRVWPDRPAGSPLPTTVTRASTPSERPGAPPGTRATVRRGSSATRHRIGSAASLGARGTSGTRGPSAIRSQWLEVYVPVGAALWIDDVRHDVSGAARVELPVGAHRVTLRLESVGYEDRRTVVLRRGAINRVRFALPTGTLEVSADSPHRVTIDGNAVGTTPLGPLAVPIGTHTVGLSKPGGAEHRYEVLVRHRASSRLTADPER